MLQALPFRYRVEEERGDGSGCHARMEQPASGLVRYDATVAYSGWDEFGNQLPSDAEIRMDAPDAVDENGKRFQRTPGASCRPSPVTGRHNDSKRELTSGMLAAFGSAEPWPAEGGRPSAPFLLDKAGEGAGAHGRTATQRAFGLRRGSR